MSAEPGSPQWGRPASRVGLASGSTLLLIGAGIGLVGGFIQAVTVDVFGFGLPVGLVIVIVTLVAAVRAAVHLFDRRRAGMLVFGGWIIVSVLLAYEWPGGDVVITRGPVALLYLFGGAILASAAANVPARLRPPLERRVPSGGAESGKDEP